MKRAQTKPEAPAAPDPSITAALSKASDADFYREYNLRRLRLGGHRCPSELHPITEPPPDHVMVLLWISDRSVAIEFFPVVARNSPEFDKPMWWSGIPGHHVRMGRLDGSNGWVIEGWAPLPGTIPTP